MGPFLFFKGMYVYFKLTNSTISYFVEELETIDVAMI